MNATHRRRFIVIACMVAGVSLAVALTLYALSQNINVFYTPTQLKAQTAIKQKTCRIGGMVVNGSVIRKQDLSIEFAVTDFKEQITIKYEGILPDLFREGQGIVALGKMNTQGEFIATQVLAKHDEKYMPPEIATVLSAASNPTKQN